MGMGAAVFGLVHIAELHFAEQPYPPGRMSSGGLCAHDSGACRALSNTMQLLRAEAQRGLLLVAGNLTASGTQSEFATALTYLRGMWRTSWLYGLGLARAVDDVYAVPGTRDHLHTCSSGLPNLAIHNPYFPSSNGRSYWFSSIVCHGIQLQLIGLDSSESRTNLWLTQGRIDPKALTQLATSIGNANVQAQGRNLAPVRVVMLNHSALASDPGDRLDLPSQDALDDFVTANKIHFVLTGHEGQPHVPRMDPGAAGGIAPNNVELRAGITLQHRLGGVGNTFLFHTIENDGTKLAPQPRWKTRCYQRVNASGPFAHVPSMDYVVAL
jgi:hypothetical protein